MLSDSDLGIADSTGHSSGSLQAIHEWQDYGTDFMKEKTKLWGR